MFCLQNRGTHFTAGCCDAKKTMLFHPATKSGSTFVVKLYIFSTFSFDKEFVALNQPKQASVHILCVLCLYHYLNVCELIPDQPLRQDCITDWGTDTHHSWALHHTWHRISAARLVLMIMKQVAHSN